MSKGEDTLKRLERKIGQLSEQLRDTKEFISNANKILLDEVVDSRKLTGKLGMDTLVSEASQTITEELKRRIERSTFFKGLAMGLLLGIVGNMLVSYFMEYLKALGMPSWGWALGVISAFVVVLCLVWQLDRESKR